MTFTKIKEVMEAERFKAVSTPTAQRIKEVMKQQQEKETIK